MPSAIPIAQVYPVGLLSDLIHLRGAWRHGPPGAFRSRLRYFLRCVRSDVRRRSYWNGYLAELEGAGHCGHGWTKARARRSLAHIIATQHWASHKPCGTVRLSADVRRQYCVTCEVKSSRREWTPLPAEVADGRG